MSRPNVKEPKTIVQLGVSPDAVRWLDARASAIKGNRSAAARELFETALGLEAEGLWTWIDEQARSCFAQRAGVLIGLVRGMKQLQKTKLAVYNAVTKQKEISKMIKQEYAEYLETMHWAKTRAAALKRANNKCQICRAQHQLNVHHITYDRLGKELSADLVVLCKSCWGGYKREGLVPATLYGRED